jgi:hypothetical protein
MAGDEALKLCDLDWSQDDDLLDELDANTEREEEEVDHDEGWHLQVDNFIIDLRCDCPHVPATDQQRRWI